MSIKVACLGTGINKALIPHLFVLSQSEPLEQVVTEVCKVWNIDAALAAKCALKEEDTGVYITQENRHTLTDGSVLVLSKAPEIAAREQLKKLQLKAEMGESLDSLRYETKDATFAHTFIGLNGLEELTKVITIYKADPFEQQKLGYALRSYAQLVAHKDAVEGGTGMTERAKFVESLIPLTRIVQKDAVQKWIIHSVLEIAAILVLHAPAGFQLVNEKLGLGEIIKHIQSMPAGTTSPPDLQEAAVKLINSMITACPPAHRLAFFGELKRHQIINALMPRVTSPGGVEEGMAHALYVLQTNFVMEDQGDVAAAPIVWDKTNVDGLGLITRLATAKSGTANDSPKKLALLGFPDITNAKVAFEEYPGAVALDCISFLARKSPEIYKQYEKMADKPAEYRCPFIRAGRDITALLLRILDVVPGSTPDETSTGYLPLYFTTPKAFQELFCVAMEVMAVTWVDMEAINIDQDKVVLVVEKQIRNVLDHHELKAAPDIRMFREAVLKHKYNDVQQAEVKAMSDQFTAQMASAVVKEVKEQIRPETIQLVQRQRLAVMGKGDFFSTVEKGRITTKRFYAVLSPNHKTLHWSDPKDDYQVGSSEHRPTIAQLPPATTGEGGGYVAVEDIHMFEVGVEIAALKALKSKPNDDFVARTFAILIGQEEWLTFVAPTRGSGVVWIDGLRVLMRKPNREHETVKEWQQLLDLQMHLRLMDTHGVTLPTGKPQVPALPTQFNFLYADTADQSPA